MNHIFKKRIIELEEKGENCTLNKIVCHCILRTQFFCKKMEELSKTDSFIKHFPDFSKDIFLDILNNRILENRESIENMKLTFCKVDGFFNLLKAACISYGVTLDYIRNNAYTHERLIEFEIKIIENFFK